VFDCEDFVSPFAREVVPNHFQFEPEVEFPHMPSKVVSNSWGSVHPAAGSTTNARGGTQKCCWRRNHSPPTVHSDFSRIVMAHTASSKPITPPPFSISPNEAPFTCATPPSPRSCLLTSYTIESPVAPMGCPF